MVAARIFGAQLRPSAGEGFEVLAVRARFGVSMTTCS